MTELEPAPSLAWPPEARAPGRASRVPRPRAQGRSCGETSRGSSPGRGQAVGWLGDWVPSCLLGKSQTEKLKSFLGQQDPGHQCLGASPYHAPPSPRPVCKPAPLVGPAHWLCSTQPPQPREPQGWLVHLAQTTSVRPSLTRITAYPDVFSTAQPGPALLSSPTMPNCM